MKATFSLSTTLAFLLYLPHLRPSNACHAKEASAFLSSMPTFLRNGRKRVGFSPQNIGEPTPLQSLRSCIDKGKPCRWNNKQTPNRFSSSPPAKLLRHIKANVARILSLFSNTRHSCSRNGPSDPIPNHFIPPRDSHHSEALEDCIEFINSSHRKSL